MSEPFEGVRDEGVEGECEVEVDRTPTPGNTVAPDVTSVEIEIDDRES